MSDEVFWYASRATGVASMMLFTAVVVLGAVTAGRRRPQGGSATIVMAVHRWLSLGLVAFLVVHIVTAIADGYVSIGWLATLVPFTSGFETLLVGLGTIALDLMLAVVVTSLLRHRIPERVWRLVHWAAYLSWPIALVHGYAMGTSDQPALRALTIGCGLVGAAAVVWRAVVTHADQRQRQLVNAQEWS